MDTNKYIVIYKLTSPSGKAYIGQSFKFQNRLAQHKISNSLIGKALRKYGTQTFIIEFLHETQDPDYANHLEATEINICNTLAPNGYNLTQGGEGNIPCDETLYRMRSSQTFRRKKEQQERQQLRDKEVGKQIERYIKVYKRILMDPELSRLEALLICEIMSYPNGCWSSAFELGKLLQSDTRTIQKKVKSLFERKWLTLLRLNKRKRILWATPKEATAGPLFEYKKKAEEAMRKRKQQVVKQMTKCLFK